MKIHGKALVVLCFDFDASYVCQVNKSKHAPCCKAPGLSHSLRCAAMEFSTLNTKTPKHQLEKYNVILQAFGQRR